MKQEVKYMKIIDFHRILCTITIDNGDYKFSQDTHICEQWGVYTIFKNKEESDNYKRKREHLNYICLNQYKLKYVLTDEEIENIYNKLKKL